MKFICLFLPILILAHLIQAEAETIFVEPLTGSGLEQTDLNTVTELIKSSISEMKEHEITSTPDNANIVLKGRLLKLGESYILSLIKYENGKKVFASKMKAANMDEMDNISSRLTRAVINSARAETDARVSNLTENEATQGTRRRQALKQWEVGFGPAFPKGLNSEGSSVNWRFGYIWGIDNQFDLRFVWEFLNVKKQSDVTFTDAHIGLNYFLSDANTSVYFTGDLGYGAASGHEESNSVFIGSKDKASGFSAGAGIGVKFFRVSNVNLGVQVRYCRILEKTEVTKETPEVTNLNLSVYF